MSDDNSVGAAKKETTKTPSSVADKHVLYGDYVVLEIADEGIVRSALFG